MGNTEIVIIGRTQNVLAKRKTKTRQKKFEFWMFLSQEFQPSIFVLRHVGKIYLHELSFHWFTVMFYLQCQMPILLQIYHVSY